ncbi:MAG: hypothetical protein NVSMB9_30810 [Isosphaeraceae bacterium]
MLLASLLAGLIAWSLGETSLLHVEAEKVEVNLMGRVLRETTSATDQAARASTARRSFAVFGGLLGLGMGVAAGLASGSVRRASVAAVLGLLLGGVTGAVMPFLILPLHDRLILSSTSGMVSTLVVHGGLWIPLGVVGGLAFGIGLGDRTRLLHAVVGAALGALLGVVAFELIGALALPLADTGQPISTTPSSRFLANVLIAILTAFLVLASAGRDTSRRGLISRA